jgi:GR25 family glycosyltransferase involved in LPS biosynthesis
MIHLQRAKEREPLIRALKAAIGGDMTVMSAVDGREAVEAGHPTACALEGGKVRTAGEVGCLLSHVEAARQALASDAAALVLFEDDCQASPQFSVEALRGYFRDVREFVAKFQGPAGLMDLTLLSTGGCYKQIALGRRFKRTDRFNCSHALLLSRPMMEKLIGAYEFLKGRGLMAPVDGLYGLLLQAEGKVAACPLDERVFFSQAAEVPSYVLTDGVAPRESLRPTEQSHKGE